jgi:biofilm PGA synthesis protein PgaA
MDTKRIIKFKQFMFVLSITCFVKTSLASNEDLIELARQGNYSPAISSLQAQVRANPSDQNNLSDLITILGWAGKWDEALDAAARLNTQTAPLYGIKAYGLAAKRAGKLQLALGLYELAINRNLPVMDYDLYASKIGVLCDLKKCQQAVDEAEKLLENQIRPEPENTHALLTALAKAYVALDKKVEALAIYQRILSVSPTNTGIIKEYTFLLGALKAGLLAKQLALTNSKIFSDEGQRSLQQDAVSQQMRFGKAELNTYWSNRKFAANELAIRESYKLKSSNALAGDTNSRVAKSSDWDRLITLNDGSKWTTVIEEYQRLKNQSIKSNSAFEAPGVALAAVADAYQSNSKPKQAIELYKQALNQKDASEELINEWKINLTYAYLDNNEYENALALTQITLRGTSVIKNKGVAGLEMVNSVYSQWRLMEILVYLYSDNLPKANELISKFLTIGPYNGEVRNARASLSQAYGLNRLALSQYLESSVDNPNDLSSRAGLASSLLVNREFKIAREQITELTKLFPSSGPVLKTTKELAIHDGIELSTSINTSGSGSDSNRFSDLNLSNSPESRISTEIKSGSINENYKLGGFIFDRSLKDLDSILRDRVTGIALHITKPNYLASINVNRSSLLNTKLGTSISSTWIVNDNWQYNGKLELASKDISLRTLDFGINANTIGLGITYKTNDTSVWNANAEVWKFNDNNTRSILIVSQKQRLNYNPHLRIHSKLSVTYASNSNTDVSYFSPKNESLIEGEIEIDHLVWKDYEYTMKQQLWTSIGRYAEYGFGSNTNWSIKYGHEWRNDPWWSLSYGLGVNLRHYGGVADKQRFIFANGTWYF